MHVMVVVPYHAMLDWTAGMFAPRNAILAAMLVSNAFNHAAGHPQAALFSMCALSFAIKIVELVRRKWQEYFCRVVT